ncbi:MAG: TetR/AcrR family transcriptional regulator [Burkholderiaceae bacterium]|nr:TetR/AcrR family transcriptional regulator [Burkholderiaceae bacterium]MEB2351690.1 TetR/AcrR family transcriptional regulator [Burkholderiaceae bacterium]
MDSSPRHLPADARRAETVDTVLALAAEQHPSEITTAAIARRMGLTQGALFRHFPTKDAIWAAVMAWVAERLMARVERAAQAAASPLAALEAMFVAHAGFIAEHPGVPRMLFGELQRGRDSATRRMVQTLLGRYRDRLRTLIEQGQAAGELDAQVDPDHAALLFVGTIQGLVMQSMVAGDVRRLRSDAPAAFATLCRGIGRKP